MICSLLFGERYEYSDLEFQEMRHIVDEGFLLMDKTYALNYVPEMRFMPSMKEQYSMHFINPYISMNIMHFFKATTGVL